jgi:hypothetical protein
MRCSDFPFPISVLSATISHDHEAARQNSFEETDSLSLALGGAVADACAGVHVRYFWLRLVLVARCALNRPTGGALVTGAGCVHAASQASACAGWCYFSYSDLCLAHHSR